MTSLSPSLQIRRVVVAKSGQHAYDEKFGSGLNIIAGDNGSGKTTIADLIFFGLGGELTDWKDEAKSCDRVYIEALFRDTVICLSREISEEAKRPLEVAYGTLGDVFESGSHVWFRYSYAAQGTKLSFSQVLFEAAGLPEYRGNLDSRLTMHQILRLIYVDQTTPFNRLFMLDDHDSPLLRQAIGDLLVGVYDHELYDTEEQIRRKNAEFDSVQKQIRSIQDFLGKSNDNLSVEVYSRYIEEKLAERERLQKEIRIIETQHDGDAGEEFREWLKKTEGKIRTLKAQVSDLDQRIERIDFNIADSSRFLDALERSVRDQQELDALQDFLGSSHFHFCPSCLQLLPDTSEEGHCHLCRQELQEATNQQRVRITNELYNQMNETKYLLEKRRTDRQKLVSDAKSARRSLREWLNSYHDADSSITPDRIRRLNQIYERLGYINSEIKNIENNMETMHKLNKLIDEKGNISKTIAELKTRRETLIEARNRRQERTHKRISETVKQFLVADLRRESDFAAPERVDFDFAGNSIEVNGKQNFGASSNVILKNAFHLALHAASTSMNEMRYPRFTIFDNIEDKGMQVERSQNFQRIIAEECNKSERSHQIIMTTSMIAPDLFTPEYVVGDYYTEESKSLKLL